MTDKKVTILMEMQIRMVIFYSKDADKFYDK